MTEADGVAAPDVNLADLLQREDVTALVGDVLALNELREVHVGCCDSVCLGHRRPPSPL